MTVTIYHNPACGTSRNTLAMTPRNPLRLDAAADPRRNRSTCCVADADAKA
jgi:hypothetical protein